MIKANELRIGNFLQGEPFQNRFGKSDGIIQITTYGIYLMSSNEVDLGLNPIPLTEDWLLKAGFIKTKNIGSYLKPPSNSTKDFGFVVHSQYPNNDKLFSGFTECYYFEQSIYVTGGLKYVHQLQNLYFTLTGEELVFSSTET